MNTLLYAMFGDPWGGWSFGSRYMIPSAAVVILFIPFVLTRFKRNIFIYLFIAGLIIYSIFINTLGAVTTTEIPPKQEAKTLISFIPYTYEYNLQLLEKNESYSMLNTYLLKDIHGKTIWIYESLLLILLTLLPMAYFYTSNFKKSYFSMHSVIYNFKQGKQKVNQAIEQLRKLLKKLN